MTIQQEKNRNRGSVLNFYAKKSADKRFAKSAHITLKQFLWAKLQRKGLINFMHVCTRMEVTSLSILISPIVSLKVHLHLWFTRRELLRKPFTNKWVRNPLLNFSAHTKVYLIASVNAPTSCSTTHDLANSSQIVQAKKSQVWIKPKHSCYKCIP